MEAGVRSSLSRKLVTLIVSIGIVAAVVVAGVLAVQNLFLDWKMLDTMYLSKAGVSWWASFTINGYLFTMALPIAAIITLAGPLHESKVLNLVWVIFHVRSRSLRGIVGRKPSLLVVAAYKAGLFGVSYLAFTFLFTNQTRTLSLLFLAANSGVGSWGQVAQALTLIFTPMAPVELVASLVATIEVQYTIFLIFMALLLTTIGIRVALDLVHYFARAGSRSYTTVRTLSSLGFLAVLGLLWLLLVVPHMEVDVGTQFFVLHLLVLFIFACIVTGVSFALTISGKYGRAGEIPRMTQPFATGLALLTLALVVGPLLYTGYIVAGPIQGPLWEEWHWNPLMTKELYFSRWSAGLDVEEVPYQELVNNTGVSDAQMLEHIRLWDFQASRNKMRAQTFANWMALADSDIVYMDGREYWIAPYSLSPPSREDFHKRYILYTHAEGCTALDASSASGEFLTPSQFQSIFGVNANFPIYYGEAAPGGYINGYSGIVLVDTAIAPETGSYSWSGEPDYVLTGSELTLKKLVWAFEDFSFAWLAFSEPQAKILMNREVVDRVKSVLLPFLEVDDDPYLVFDRAGQQVYYCVAIYSAYPLQLEYAQAPYMRLLGWAVVSCSQGTILWVRNPNANPAQFFIETMYRSWYPWQDPPSWLVEQLRYPEDLIDLQLSVDFYYHVDDPWIWRSEADFFEKPHSQPNVHYVLFPVDGGLKWVGYQAVRYIRHEAQKMAGFYLLFNGMDVGRTIFARCGTVDPATHTPISPVFGVDVAVESFEQHARSDLVLIQPYRIGNRLLVPLSGRLVYIFPVYAEQLFGESLVETLVYIGMVDAEDINLVSYAPTVAEAYASFFYGYNQTVTGVEFIETSLTPNDIHVGEQASLSYLVKNGNTTTSQVAIELALHTDNFDVTYHGVNVTPTIEDGFYRYAVGQATMYPQDVMGATITLQAKTLDPGLYLVTYILELRILVDGQLTQTEYFYLTVRSAS